MQPIKQSLLVIIGVIVLIILVVSVFSVFSSKVPSTRQAIHVFDTPSLKLSNPNGMIKISDMRPNSMAWFWYPNPNQFKDRDDFDRFVLIRLPDYLGGTTDNASAFRAYSAIEPSSHCLVKYWPEEGRRYLEDPCGGNAFEPVFGHLTRLGGNPILVSENLGLPYLTITSDEDGYLYVEPPVWTEDQNGVKGIGRKISEEEKKIANEFTKTREEEIKKAMTLFYLPDILATGHRKSSISNDGIRTTHVEYENPNSGQSEIFVYYEYCNCTKSSGILANEEARKTQSQLLELNNIPIVAYPNKINYVNGTHDDYIFVFYNHGYKILLFTNQKLEPGLDLVKELIDFQNEPEKNTVN